MSGIRLVWSFANNIIRSARQMVNDELKSLNLSSAEGNIILHLFTQEDLVSQEEIVGELDISKPAVSRALDSLEAKGYVFRRKKDTDRRVSLVGLTEKARRIGPQVEEIYNKVFSLASYNLTDEEINHFAEMFRRLSENFTRVKNKGGRD